VNKKSDIELVTLARAGDKTAFGELIERYQPMVKRIAVSMVRHEALAQELSQEAMLQAYLSLEHLREIGQFKSWLYGITLNVCKSYLRTQKFEFFSFEELMGGIRIKGPLMLDAAPTPERVAEALDLHRLILEAVESLSPRNRSATLLFYYEQFTIGEIATLLGVSTVAVKGRLHKSRQQLKGKLLPLYEEINQVVSIEERRAKMIEVTVVDVVDAADVLQSENNDQEELVKHKVIILLDEPNRRFLPIWVGLYEADAIALNLVDVPMKRPLTYTFMAKIMEGAGVELEEVRVETLHDDTFYAIAKIRNGNTVREIDARPSDAINLALQMKCPIYVAEAVMDQAQVDISDAEALPAGAGIKQIESKATKMCEDFEARKAARAQLTEQEKEEKAARTQQQLLAVVLGLEE
jgi:RNA polymerase sigma factor (sigma-70 family)